MGRDSCPVSCIWGQLHPLDTLLAAANREFLDAPLENPKKKIAIIDWLGPLKPIKFDVVVAGTGKESLIGGITIVI